MNAVEWKQRKEKIVELHHEGKTQVAIAKQFGVSRQRIQQILTNNANYRRWWATLSPEERRQKRLNHKEYNREWRKRNPKKVSSYSRKWEKKHPEKVLEMRRKSYYRHKKERLAQQHKRYIENEEVRTYKQEWNKQRYIINKMMYKDM
mgnify:CR=1 FL=1